MKRRIMLPRLLQNLQRPKRFKPANEEECVEAVFLELGGDGAEVDGGEGAVRAEFGTAAGHPVVDSEPGEFVYVVVEQAAEAVVDREGFVAPAETVAGCCTRGGVHTSSGCSHTVVVVEELLNIIVVVG